MRPTSVVIVVVSCVLLLFVCGQTNTQHVPGYQFSQEFLDTRYQLSWAISPDQQFITIEIIARHQGWIGFGLHEKGDTSSNMARADFVIGLYDDSGMLIETKDAHARPQGNGRPLDDTDPAINGTYDIISSSGFQWLDEKSQEFRTRLTFTRKLSTGDTNGDNEIAPGSQSILVAYGATNEFQKHQAANRELIFIDFFSGDIVDDPSVVPDINFKMWHGTLMTISFVFCMVLGMFVARYLKQYWWWFPLHIGLQVCGLVGAAVGFGLALYMVEGAHFQVTHAYFGLSTLIVAFIAPFLGTAAHFMFDPSRNRVPIFPDFLHWWTGRGAILLSFITVYLGMELLRVPYELEVGLSIVLCLYLVTYFFLEYANIGEHGFKAYFSLSSQSHAVNDDSIHGSKDYNSYSTIS